MSETEFSLDRAEAIAILEEIAREAQNGAARIAAIKQLIEMQEADSPAISTPDFADLDELGPKRAARAA